MAKMSLVDTETCNGTHMWNGAMVEKEKCAGYFNGFIAACSVCCNTFWNTKCIVSLLLLLSIFCIYSLPLSLFLWHVYFISLPHYFFIYLNPFFVSPHMYHLSPCTTSFPSPIPSFSIFNLIPCIALSISTTKLISRSLSTSIHVSSEPVLDPSPSNVQVVNATDFATVELGGHCKYRFFFNPFVT